MSVWKVETGQVIRDAQQEPATAKEGKQRVDEVMKKLADIVYDEPLSVGLSAVVSYLAVLLADMKDPSSEFVNTTAVLHSLVQLNLANQRC